jgi:undecaprenyl diphosphate synthase
MNDTDTQTIPRHIGFIMDGNRRWATDRGLPAFKGHEAGVDALERVADACFDRGVEYMSAYTFSTENWSRTREEVGFLMGLVTKVLTDYLKKFHDKGIKIVIIGTRSMLSKTVLKAIDEAEEKTKNNTKGTLALCFNYGGRQEVVDTIKHVVDSGVDLDTLTSDSLMDHIYRPDVPPCDLIVRTSGEHRLSGFMLMRSEYAELLFENKKHWPDIDASDVDAYIAEYSARNRRFGK